MATRLRCTFAVERAKLWPSGDKTQRQDGRPSEEDGLSRPSNAISLTHEETGSQRDQAAYLRPHS